MNFILPRLMVLNVIAIRKGQGYSILGSMLMVMLISTSMLAPASGSCQVLPLDNYNISLDFGGQDIAVTTMPPDYEECVDTGTSYIKLVDKNTNSSSFVYLIKFGALHPISDSEKDLMSILSSMCNNVSIQPYQDGYISNGSDNLNGQELWGIVSPLDVEGGKFKSYFAVIASFANETLNEHLVKTAKIQINGTLSSLETPSSGHAGCRA